MRKRELKALNSGTAGCPALYRDGDGDVVDAQTPPGVDRRRDAAEPVPSTADGLHLEMT